MKKIFLCCWLLFLFSLNSRAQGSDVIFWIDNSGSISVAEYLQLQTTIDTIIQKTLRCNPQNRIAIAQYAAVAPNGPSRIYIETQFTNSYPSPVTFQNRSNIIGMSGRAWDGISILSNAINSIPDARILSPITTLPLTPNNPLVVYFFTDAPRDNDLVNGQNNLGSNVAFQNYTNFKSNFGATFIVNLVTSPNNTAIDLLAEGAAASIASVGGQYNQAIEGYPADPQGSGTLPRYLLSTTDFFLTNAQIDSTIINICSVAQPVCSPIVLLSSTADDVASGIQDNRQASDYISASNVIGNNGVGIYHGANQVVMTSGFHAQSNSRFRAYIEDCTGNFNGREAKENTEKNSLPESGEVFGLYPNPTNGIVNISNSELLKSISILSIEGRLMLNKALPENSKSYELDITNYKNGLYIVNIETISGKTLTKKLIKN